MTPRYLRVMMAACQDEMEKLAVSSALITRAMRSRAITEASKGQLKKTPGQLKNIGSMFAQKRGMPAAEGKWIPQAYYGKPGMQSTSFGTRPTTGMLGEYSYLGR